MSKPSRPEAASNHRRSAAECADQTLSWARSDTAFFAAGACHILAFAAVARCPNLHVVHLRPTPGASGHHVIATDGNRAFDFNGWSAHSALIEVNDQGQQAIRIDDDLLTFCSANAHRPPDAFAGDVTNRAHEFLDRML